MYPANQTTVILPDKEAKRGLVPGEDLRNLYRKTFEAYDGDLFDSVWEERESEMSAGYSSRRAARLDRV